MTTLAKKIKKAVKTSGSIICISPSDQLIDDMSMYYSSVFVLIDRDPIIKRKNVIYRNSIDGLNKLPDIKFLYFGEEAINQIHKLQSLINQYSAFVIIQSGEWLDKKTSKSLTGNYYEITEKHKNWQLWKKR